jgi:hypothetical protein
MKEAMVHLEQYEVVPALVGSNRPLCRNVGVRSEQAAAMNAKNVAQYA